MNEDLEAKLNEITFCHGCKYEYAPREECPCNLIAKELKRKENLAAMCDRLANLLGLKEQDYLELETLIAKKDKALEIIKNNCEYWNTIWLFDCIKKDSSYEDYLEGCKATNETEYATQEEYNLLKEVVL